MTFSSTKRKLEEKTEKESKSPDYSSVAVKENEDTFMSLPYQLAWFEPL